MSQAVKSNLISSGNAKIDGVYHTAEWLVTAFASTLVFIIFVMQVYRIPTGSMGETLFGAHFRVRCQQCGFRYEHDYLARNYGIDNRPYIPTEKQTLGPRFEGFEMTPQGPQKKFACRSSQCPICGHAEPDPIVGRDIKCFLKKGDKFVPAPTQTVYKGDQIFVLKSIYQFFEPKRWDVIVFKEPDNPRINYIKRCIGLPGETLQIIDGDIFIDGQIQRKPEMVQEELWMPVYNNDYQPARPNQESFNKHTWQQPFVLIEGSQWNLSANGPKYFSLDTNTQAIQRIQYEDRYGKGFRATYAYDDPGYYSSMPVCSDLMVQYYLDMNDNSAAGAEISKYGIVYQGWVKTDGTMQIIRVVPEAEDQVLIQEKCNTDDLENISRFRFVTLDHQLVLELGKTKLVYDLGTGIDDAGTNRQASPQTQILGYGKLNLSHIAFYRDIHYISDDSNMKVLRATESNPMVLGENEFFACGDNSPASSDSRLWHKEGIGNNGITYPMGVVPRDYLVGKAMFVHWPGGYRIEEGLLSRSPIPPRWLRWIPYVDGMKVIYGGKD